MTRRPRHLAILARVLPLHRSLPHPLPARPNLETMPVGDLHQHIVDLRNELDSAREHRDLVTGPHPAVSHRIGRLVRDVWAAERVYLRRVDDPSAVAAAVAGLTGRAL